MASNKPWKPKKRDLSRAWNIKKRGKRNGGTIADICKALKISKSTYQKNRPHFDKFFRQMEYRLKRGLTGNKPGRPAGGRKLDVSDINLDLLEQLVLTGYSLEKIAKYFGIHRDTLLRYRKEFPEIQDIIDNAKMRDTAEIMISLSQKAKGYRHKATHFSSYMGFVNETEYTKQYPPDTEAARLILANRIGFIRDVEPKRTNNKGKILELLDGLMKD